MDLSVLEKSTLFSGLSAKEMRDVLEEVPHHIQCYDKDETIFHLMEDAARVGIILEGKVEAQKSFPNGSQINVSVRGKIYGYMSLEKQKELAQELNRFLGSLKEKDRNIFIRRYFYLESGKQIAERYGMNEANVNVILSRTRSRLKEHLGKEGWL